MNRGEKQQATTGQRAANEGIRLPEESSDPGTTSRKDVCGANR